LLQALRRYDHPQKGQMDRPMRSIDDEREPDTPASAGPEGRPSDWAYKPGDRSDFERVYLQHYRSVMLTINAMLKNPAAAEDCAQAAFERAWKAWDHWEPSAPPGAWLHRIAINTATSYLRYEKLRQPAELLRRLRPTREEGKDPSLDHSPLMAALHQVPHRQAAALVLRHYHGYSNREIGAALGISESTIASQLAAGKRRLRELLAEDPAFADQAREWDMPEQPHTPANAEPASHPSSNSQDGPE